MAELADHGLKVTETFTPSTSEIDFLTEKINEESRAQNIPGDAYPFGIFLRKSTTTSPSMPPETTVLAAEDNNDTIVGGCNGSVVYGSIYTDQLWVDAEYRGKGLGKLLMEKVHELGRREKCTLATVGTMSFQGAEEFYKGLGYEVEFVRDGYVNGGKMIYLKRKL